MPKFKIKQGMCLPIAIAAIDSGSKQPMEFRKHIDFIRGTGYPEAWEKVPLRSLRVSAVSVTPVQTSVHGKFRDVLEKAIPAGAIFSSDLPCIEVSDRQGCVPGFHQEFLGIFVYG